MRVLHVYAGNLFGGIETLLVTLAKLRDLYPQMEPSFALCFGGRLSQELVAIGAKVDLLGAVQLRAPWQVLRARRQLARIIQRDRIDVVICHACWPQLIFGGTVLATQTPLAFWCHDTPQGQSWIERGARFVPPDLAIANSDYTRKHLPLLYPHVPNLTIYAPVVPLSSPSVDMRAALGTPADRTVIVQVSRLEPWKGQATTIAALGQVCDLDNWECWIVGGIQRDREREYYNQLQQQCQQLGIAERVRFLGERQDVPDLLAAADIFCQPNSAPEPFGIAFIEALSAGLPIVTTAIGGGGEIVTPDCGYTLPPEDVAAIAKSLRELILSPELRAQFATAAKHRARSLCDPHQQLDLLARSLAQLKN